MNDDLISRDLKHVWHPCSQMKDYESFPPVEVIGAKGSRLLLRDGGTLIDAVSSWWCKSLGHGHPRLRNALERQLGAFEHIISANTTNRTLVELSERLAELAPGLDRVFYASEGSTAVEIAAKMALHAQQLLGRPERTRFAALENGYHGESAMALALGDLGIYKDPYRAMLPTVDFIGGLPYVTSRRDALWQDCASHWPAIEAVLEGLAPELCALVLEPVVQGAGGMRIYSPDLLRRLRNWTKARGVFLIADEIMTGFGRTGVGLACEHAGISPDMLCLSKGLTAGWLPMSAVLTTSDTYALFYDDYASGKSFLHSNTYAGNALAAAVALEAIKVYEDEGTFAQAAEMENELRELMGQVALATGCLTGLRALGAVCAVDLALSPELQGKRMGFQVYREAVARGALLRPLGNTLYWLPPLNTPHADLEALAEITTGAIRSAVRAEGNA